MKTKSKIYKAEYEYTDTFGGEANYSWVNRGEVEADSEAGIIRAAKAAVGLNGIRCTKEDYDFTITLRPKSMATVLFIEFYGR